MVTGGGLCPYLEAGESGDRLLLNSGLRWVLLDIVFWLVLPLYIGRSLLFATKPDTTSPLYQPLYYPLMQRAWISQTNEWKPSVHVHLQPLRQTWYASRRPPLPKHQHPDSPSTCTLRYSVLLPPRNRGETFLMVSAIYSFLPYTLKSKIPTAATWYWQDYFRTPRTL